MDDYLLILTPQEFQQLYQEVEFKLEKLNNKNNVIQQNLDVDIIKKELYQMIKQEMDALQIFITDIKDQMNTLEKNANSIDTKNKFKRLKDLYLKETQRNKAICRILNNKSSFQSEKGNDEISILSKSDTGGIPDFNDIPPNLEYKESNIQQSNFTDEDQKPLPHQNSSLQEKDLVERKSFQQLQNNNQNQQQQKQQQNEQNIIQREDQEEEIQEEINNYIYFIILVIVAIIAGLIVWLLYQENIL